MGDEYALVDKPLSEAAYEVFRSVFFDCPPGQSASAAKQALGAAIAANPLPLFQWLTDAGIVQHVMFAAPGATIRMSVKDAPPFDQAALNKEGE